MKLRTWMSLALCVTLLCIPTLTQADEPPKIDTFTFMIGPYPTKGLFEYHLDAGRVHQVYPKAANWQLIVERNGQRIKEATGSVPVNGFVKQYIEVGTMPDKSNYTLRMIVRDQDKKELFRQEKTFTRQVQPFETAPPVGVSDIIVAPFTDPLLNGNDASVWGRTYHHGTDGLLTQITAADEDLLASPMTLSVRAGNGELAVLKGDGPKLTPDGKYRINYDQTFTGQGIKLTVHGALDYDGFYKFTITMAPDSSPVLVHELRLDIPFRDKVAQLLEAAVTWRRNLGPQKEVMGSIDPKQGILWDSHTFPASIGARFGNMPPFFFIGDDDRGLTYSNASEEGMFNDEKKAAAQLERRGDEVIYTAWFVNSDLELKTPRTFEFALQASPFKAMPEHARLWRNQIARMPYRNGILFTNWFTDGSYPTYGRFLTLDLLKKYAEKTGADQVGVMASAVSESGGTPEYLQFWHEWGSDLRWPLVKRNPPEEWAVKMMQEANLPVNPYIRVESSSNVSKTNVEYRTWWFDQEVKHSGISYIYQDNPPHVYYYDPPNGYGYTRDDGRHESTSAIWNSRDFAKRIATLVTENGRMDSPYLWVNAISPMLPGRSFSRKMLNGEYLYTKLFTLGQIRVMASKQWGTVLDWYPFPQTWESPYPNIGPVRKYWREVFSRLLLHDITNISGGDDAGYTENWFNALDIFWLDDPTVQWHPYYRNDTKPVTKNDTTLISTYTARGRALLFVSNQSEQSTVELVSPGNLQSFVNGELKYYYDAETGEQIERTSDGSLRLFLRPMDYRLLIGFETPWKFATANMVKLDNLRPQSALDPQVTLTAISRRLLRSPKMANIPNAHRLYEKWMQLVMEDFSTDLPEVKYFDAKACSDIDMGAPGIEASVFFNPKRGALMINWVNNSDKDVSLKAGVRDKLSEKAGLGGHNYVIHPIYGNSEWAFVDIPAHEGLIEVLYGDAPDFWNIRHGPLKMGTMLENFRKAVVENQKQLNGRPIK